MRAPVGHVVANRAAWWLLTRGWRPMLAAARLYRASLLRHARVVLVTGTYAKTTTTRALRAALGLPEERWFELNANCLGEVAWTVLREPPWCRTIVVEVGTGNPGKMRRYARAVHPETAIVTWVGHEHIRAFGTLERVRDEKAEAVRVLPRRGTAILNADDPHVRWMATQTAAPVLWFGLDAGADVSAVEVELDWPRGLRGTLAVRGARYPFRTRLTARPMIYAVLAAVAAGVAAGRRVEDVLEALAHLTPTRGRLQPVELPNGAWILSDEYKGTPETVLAAIDLLAQVPARRRIAVMGELNNFPTASAQPHYEAVGERLSCVADRVVVVGPHLQSYLPGLRRGGLGASQVLHAPTVPAAIDALRALLADGDVVLLKGYEDQGLRRILPALQGRDVRCAIRRCALHHHFCDDCPLLGDPVRSRGAEEAELER